MTTASASDTAPNLVLPASEQVAAGATIDAAGISYSDSAAAANAGAMYLHVTASDGTLSATELSGAAVSGSGTASLTLTGSYADVNHALASLAYTAGATGSSDSISFDLWNQNGVQTTGALPVAITGASNPGTGGSGSGSTGSTSSDSGPTLTEPASETVAPGGTVAVTGSYFDTYGPNHPGSMYVEAIVKNGTVQATDAAGNPVAGSGTSAIRLNTDYATINAVLHSLTYTAGPTAGSDSIYMEVWNQLGTVRIDTIPVTISAGGSSGGGTGGSGGSGGGGGTGSGTPALTEPSSATVAAGGSQALAGSYSDSFAAANSGTMYLSVSAGSGTLTATDASGQAVAGAGTHSIALSTDYADVNAILHSLSYTAGSGAASDTIRFDLWNQAGVETTGTTAITISGGSSAGGGGTGGGGAPVLTTPATASVTAGSSTDISGSYADSVAQNNPGAMYISITDSTGTLSATDAAGNAVAGSGSNTITAQTGFVDVNAILASLHYTAPGSSGSDTIHFDLWNQDGVETTGATTVSIDPPAVAAAVKQASATMLTDFAAPQPIGSIALLPPGTGTPSSSAMLGSIGNQPIGVPLAVPH